MRGREQKFVWQSVHMIFEGKLAGAWADGEARTSRMVLIGVQVDANELSTQFRACLAAPEIKFNKARNAATCPPCPPRDVG